MEFVHSATESRYLREVARLKQQYGQGHHQRIDENLKSVLEGIAEARASNGTVDVNEWLGALHEGLPSLGARGVSMPKPHKRGKHRIWRRGGRRQ